MRPHVCRHREWPWWKDVSAGAVLLVLVLLVLVVVCVQLVWVLVLVQQLLLAVLLLSGASCSDSHHKHGCESRLTAVH